LTTEDQTNVLKLSMWTLKEYYGLNLGKYTTPVKQIGYQLGVELARQMSAPSRAALIEELARDWFGKGIGRMAWEDESSLMLRLEDCSDCLGKGYGAGYLLCPFKEGLLEAVLEARLEKRFRVKEVERCGTGASSCLFKIRAA
jgi:predicted hydrocarbon binding protein